MTAAYAAPSEPVARLLGKLDGIRRNGSGWMARCPSHEDRQASLSVTAGDDGRALLFCHAGCPVEAVTGAAGISTADLFEPRPDTARPPRTSRRREIPPDGRPTLYPIRGTDGEPVAVHVRQDTPSGKRIAWCLPDGTAGLGGIATSDLPLYGSEQLAKWDTSRPVIVAEGEKAALALLGAGFRAVGTVTGAATAPSVAVLQSLRGHHVALWPDNDDAGRKHMHKVAERLASIAGSLRVVSWPDAPPHGDAADLLGVGAPADVDALLSAAVPLTSPGPVLVLLHPEPMAATPLRLDEMAQPDATDEWMIGRFLRRGVLGIIGAPAGIGKSQIRTELGMLAAAGKGDFLDYYPVAGGPYTVLVIDEENGDAEEWRRDETHLERLELTRKGLPYYRRSFAGMDLARPAWQAWLREQVSALKVDLLILDAISAMYSLPERREELMPVYRFLRELIVSTGATVLLIHHLKKPVANERGAERVLDDLRGGLWGQVAEVAAILSPLPERRVKWRTWKRVPATELILEQTEDGPLVFASHVEPPKARSEDRVLSYIDAGATTVDEIVEVSGMRRSTVYTGLKSLRSSGIVENGSPLRRKP